LRLTQYLAILALRFRQRDEALDVLHADEICEERHQFERLGEPGVLRRDPFGDLALELARAHVCEVEDPARGSLVPRPRLHLPVRLVRQRHVPQVQLETRDPLVDEFGDALVGRVHVRSIVTGFVAP